MANQSLFDSLSNNTRKPAKEGKGKMKRNTRKFRLALTALVLVALLLAVFGGVSASAAELHVSKWAGYGSNPVFDPTAKAYYPTIVYDSGQFSGHGNPAYYKMWFGSDSGVGYAYSDDSVSWTEGTNPVSGLTNANHPHVEYYADGFTGANSGSNASGDAMYYRMWYWPGLTYSINDIRYAESADGTDWHNDQSISQVGSTVIGSGSWNRGSYGVCDVLYNTSGSATLDDADIWNNKFVMYYDATTGGDESIGLAYSTNGMHWKGYGEVLSGGGVGAWDNDYATFCTVVKDGSFYHMWYSGGDGKSNHGIGYAWATDGINWTKDSQNPILYKDDGVPWRNERTYTPVVIGQSSSWQMWFSGKDAATGNYTIGYAIASGPFPSIQAAVDAASSGDTINVAAGTYTEWQDNGYGKSAGIIIDKPLHLQGSGDDCIIRGKTGTTRYMSYCPILWVKADDIEIDHFRFDGATYTEAEPKGLRSYGIKSAWKVGSTDYAATNLNVHNNKFVYIGTAVTQDRTGGGSITLAYNAMVRETRSIWYKPAGATPGSYVDKTLGGGGFKFDYVAGGSVHDNTGIETPGVGIFLHGCDGGLTIGPNNVISAPGTTDPSDTGIHIQGCSNITIKGNTVSNFTAGEKELYNNGTTGAGIRIITSNDNVTVEGNELHDNTVGVLVTGASGSPEIHFNNIEDNEEFGVLNCASWVGKDRTYTPASVEIDATYNFWGSGGTGANKGKPGEGGNNDVSSYVDYDPWLTAPYVPTTPMTSFVVDDVKFDCKKKAGNDKIHVKGKLELATTRDISESVVVTVGTWSYTIDQMEEKGKEDEHWEYTRPKHGSGILKRMKIDWNKGTFDFEMDGLNLSGVDRPVTISVQIGDDLGQATVLTSKITEVTIDSGKKEDGAKVHVKGELGFGYICGPYPSPTNGDIIEVSVEQGTTEFGPWTIDGGNIELKGKEGESWEYKPDKNSDTVFKHAKVDWKKGTFDFDLDGVDLGSLDPAKPVQVSVTIEGETISQTVSLTAKGKKDQWKTQAIADQVRVVMSPNPIRDVHTARFQVMGTLATQVEEIRVQIYDLSGRLVWEDTALGSELDWHTDNQSGQFLANGVYLYQVQVKIDGIWINQDIGKIAVLR